jgi:hypothetical protein
VRIVLDTNILVSALIESRGPSAVLLNAWRDSAFALVSSRAQLEELRDVLARPRLQKWITSNEAAKLLDSFPEQAVMVEPAEGIDLSPDPDDNAIIATAIAGRADMIVSGDKSHMLSLGYAAGIPIVTPRDAIDRLGRTGDA